MLNTKLVIMKSHFIPSAFIILTVLSITVPGCLKDSDYDNGSIQSVHTIGGAPKIIELKLTANDASNFFVLSVANSPNDTTVNLVPVNLATADAAPQDLHVTVTLDSTIIDAYDTANQAAYTVPPPGSYTILNPVVTIPKGSHTGYVAIKFSIPDFLGQSYALGFRITKIQEPGYIISGNLSTGMVPIGVKNQYDGIYANTCTILKSGAPYNSTGGEVPLATTNANTVATGTLGNYFGPYDCEFTINSDNSVTVSSTSLPITNVGPNTYNLATKTIHVKFSILGGKYLFDQTLVYEKSR